MKYVSFVLIAVLLVACMVCLSGCGPAVTEGVVVSKDYRAPYTSTWYYPMNIGDTTMIMPMTNYHQAEWALVVESAAGDRSAWLVTESVYAAVHVGDAVRRGDDGCILISEG